jgi:hypothetical protein
MNKTSLSLSLRIHCSQRKFDQAWREPFALSEAYKKSVLEKRRNSCVAA